jgi:hypothetical protein
MKILFFIIVTFFVACTKNKEYCWQAYDALGNEIGIVCHKSESEMTAQYGIYFDRADAKKYCWKIQYPGSVFSYPENITEKMAGIFFQGAVIREKFPCGYCQKWMSREKDLYKPTGGFMYKQIKVEQYCGDTCATIFAGRIVVIRDTPDSLITVEFLQKL